MNSFSWLCGIVLIIILIIVKYAKKIYLTSKLAGPKAYPIIGNGLLFFNKTNIGKYFVSELNQFLLSINS